MRHRLVLLLALLLVIAVIGGALIARFGLWSTGTGPPSNPAEQLLTVVRGGGGPRAPAPAGAPNVVLVIGCTVRQDQTSVYGDVQGTTPFLEEVAADGVRFLDPITAAPWTRAAATALLTGRHAASIGMVDRAHGRNDHALPSDVDTLAERLRAAGWSTVGATLNPNLNDLYGFAQGFDAYLQLAGLWREVPVKVSSRVAFGRLERLLDEVEASERGQDRPLYVQVTLIDAHAPIHVPEAERARFAAEGLPPEVVSYRVGLAAFDRAVADLVGRLEARGLTGENTVLVVVNDHGEGLGFPRHHGRGHGRFLAPSAVSGVWLMRGPGVAVGHEVAGLASQVDLVPTLVGLLGLPETAAAGGVAGPGIDLSAQVRGEAVATTRDVAWTDTWFREVSRTASYRRDAVCQHNFGRPTYEFPSLCFDRETDPAHEYGFRDAGQLYLVRRWRQEQLALAEAFTDAHGAPATVEPTPGLRQQLEALGYLDGEDGEDGGSAP